MSLTVLLVTVVVLFALGLFIFRAIPGIRAYLQFRGKRLVTCPESHSTEAVGINATEAAVGAFLTEPTLRLKECSRWPERQNCGQDCLQQIEIDPQNCLVWNLVSKWYEGKSCVFCHKQIGPLHHLDHAPALLAPDLKTIEWKDVQPQQLPEVFETHRPVCWNCHVTETFRRQHPELVVDRELSIKRVH
ncbi:MAG TPA: hypothetical protein VMX38_22115 [Verrucomicrobiae bacterium]|jgi:hypothetical protein|nr:hypothetical protein [Verrucomicrobiae bacterium]